MLPAKHSKKLVILWATFLGGFTFLAATDFALIANAEWCGSADEHCLRDWIGALSGWAAAVAAGLALAPLLGQLSQQKRQTAFMLGDAEPTVDIALDLQDPRLLVVRIVNWNRRGIMILPPQVVGIGNYRWSIFETKLSGEVLKWEAGEHFLRGWEDRSAGPRVMQFRLGLFQGEGTLMPWPRETTVEITLHVFDAVPWRQSYKAHLFPT